MHREQPSWYHCTPCIAHTFGGAAAGLRGAQWPAGAEHGPKQCKAQMAHEGHAHRKQLPWGVQVVLAQVAQSARSAGLEQRLAALEHARVPGSAQGSPGGGRMTHGAAESGCEAVGAEDLSSILSRLVLLSLTCCTGHWSTSSCRPCHGHATPASEMLSGSGNKPACLHRTWQVLQSLINRLLQAQPTAEG